MSTAEGYTIDLYCDGDGCNADAQAYGVNKLAAEREAGRLGWRVFRTPAPVESVAGGRKALCPKCRHEPPKLRPHETASKSLARARGR